MGILNIKRQISNVQISALANNHTAFMQTISQHALGGCITNTGPAPDEECILRGPSVGAHEYQAPRPSVRASYARFTLS